MPVWGLALGLAFELVTFVLLSASGLLFAAFTLLRVRRRPIALRPYVPGAPYPTILLHGYSQNAGNWFVFARMLRRQGVENLTHLTLWRMFASIESHARRLERKVEKVLAETGAPRVNIVAHSMGGLVSRWYIQQRGGAARVALLVTLATPHRGTLIAYAGLGRSAREMRPGSVLLGTLDASLDKLNGCRVVAYWSNLDQLILPSRAACMGAPAEDRYVPFLGHAAFLFSPRIAGETASLLLDTSPQTQSVGDVAPV